MHETARKMALRQRVWSAAANRLKDRIVRAQLMVLRLGVAGAVLETLAVTLPAGHHGRPLFAAAGAFALAVIPVISKRYLTGDHTTRWTRTRSVSEALKADLFAARAGAAPYDGTDAEEKLADELAEIEAGASDLAAETLNLDPKEPDEPGPLSPADYVKDRVLSQSQGYYLRKAGEHKDKAERLHTAETVCAVLGAGFGAVAAGMMSAEGESAAASVISGENLAAWVAVLTTIGGAIAAHHLAMRHDRQVVTYSATAGRLDQLADEFRRKGYKAGTPEWSDFVSRCEQAISVENEGWIALWAKKT